MITVGAQVSGHTAGVAINPNPQPTNQAMNTTNTTTSNLRVERGSYRDATDDRADRWYIVSVDGPVNRSGRGYRTRRLAMDALAAMRSGMDWSALPMD